VRVRILRDDKIRLCKDEQVLYDIAFQTAKEFERFKPMYLSTWRGFRVLDRKRILAKLDELYRYPVNRGLRLLELFWLPDLDSQSRYGAIPERSLSLTL